jgi:hemoglobin/transferrin/lactoferrin receptor protein
VVTLSDQALTPRAGLVWRINPALAPYAQWSRGFRAPEPGQVNNGFTNVAAGYRSLGNSGLQPERAESLELGLRGQAGGWRWQLAAYDNRYRDFISQEAVSGAGTPANPTIFQFINLTRARIRGLEARAEWQIAPPWRLSLASAITRGTSTRDGVEQPLDSVDPARTALGLHHDTPTWGWDAEVLHAQGKSAARIRTANPPAYAPPGYTVLDLAVRWQPHPRWTLRAQLHNATDETYTPWADVRGLPATSRVIDAYTAPGRHLQLSLRHDF